MVDDELDGFIDKPKDTNGDILVEEYTMGFTITTYPNGRQFRKVTYFNKKGESRKEFKKKKQQKKEAPDTVIDQEEVY